MSASGSALARNTSRLAGPTASRSLVSAGVVYESDSGSTGDIEAKNGKMLRNAAACAPAADVVFGSVDGPRDVIAGYACSALAEGALVASCPSLIDLAPPPRVGSR